MSWKQIALLILIAYSALRAVWYAGRQRPVQSPAEVCVSLVEFGFWAWLVVSL